MKHLVTAVWHAISHMYTHTKEPDLTHNNKLGTAVTDFNPI